MANIWIKTRNSFILSNELAAVYINEDCDIIAVLKNSGQVLVDRFVDVNEATEQLNTLFVAIVDSEKKTEKKKEDMMNSFKDIGNGLSFNFGKRGE